LVVLVELVELVVSVELFYEVELSVVEFSEVWVVFDGVVLFVVVTFVLLALEYSFKVIKS
jgi:hypothetical protein